ncbi:MAG: exonuclease SbcCD subunit D [Eubacteriales bacterium]|nr:exonuclease SbcCD subunit D [Eubacteriales bacterium]
MRIFHLSDLHIGLKLMNQDLREDQEYVLEQVAAAAALRRPDAILIAGDLYDKAVPAAEAVEVFDWFILKLRQAAPEAEIMAVSGNHDSGTRINLFRDILKDQRIHMIGLPPQRPEEYIQQVTLEDSFGEVHFYLLPFVKPSMVRGITGTDEKGNSLSYDQALRRLLGRERLREEDRNVLVSHQFYLPMGKDPREVERMDSEICTVGNIDAVRTDVLEKFDYGALGHIHKPMKAGGDRFRYCGTPLACSVSEGGQQKGILEVELGKKGQLDIQVIPLRPLRQIRVIRGKLEEVLAQGCQDYVTALLTDKEELDVLDMQSRLRQAFPHLLEIRRELVRRADYRELERGEAETLDAFSLCCSFLKDLDQEERLLLQDVLNTIGEVR